MRARENGQRIEPLEPPYEPEVERTLERMMPPGIEPLKLFRTVAHNRHALDKMRSTGAYLLNFGTIDPVEREIVIHRTCGRCAAEYEWGVHVVAFGRPLGLSEEQIAATVHGSPDDAVWSERQATLVRLVDELHDTAAVSDELWSKLEAGWTPVQGIELIVLVGQYHVVSFLANALHVDLEDGAPRFADFQAVLGEA